MKEIRDRVRDEIFKDWLKKSKRNQVNIEIKMINRSIGLVGVWNIDMGNLKEVQKNNSTKSYIAKILR